MFIKNEGNKLGKRNSDVRHVRSLVSEIYSWDSSVKLMNSQSESLNLATFHTWSGLCASDRSHSPVLWVCMCNGAVVISLPLHTHTHTRMLSQTISSNSERWKCIFTEKNWLRMSYHTSCIYRVGPHWKSFIIIFLLHLDINWKL